MEASARWWAQHRSAAQAERWLDAMRLQLQSLSEFPESHGLSVETGLFPYEIRDMLLGTGSRPSHRAVFSIRGDTVYVLTVRQTARDTLTPDAIDFPSTP
jgi:plasmid stabilization system protein ParE